MALSLGDKINVSQKRSLAQSNRGSHSSHAQQAAGGEENNKDNNDDAP